MSLIAREVPPLPKSSGPLVFKKPKPLVICPGERITDLFIARVVEEIEKIAPKDLSASVFKLILGSQALNHSDYINLFVKLFTKIMYPKLGVDPHPMLSTTFFREIFYSDLNKAPEKLLAAYKFVLYADLVVNEQERATFIANVVKFFMALGDEGVCLDFIQQVRVTFPGKIPHSISVLIEKVMVGETKASYLPHLVNALMLTGVRSEHVVAAYKEVFKRAETSANYQDLTNALLTLSLRRPATIIQLLVPYVAQAKPYILADVLKAIGMFPEKTEYLQRYNRENAVPLIIRLFNTLPDQAQRSALLSKAEANYEFYKIFCQLGFFAHSRFNVIALLNGSATKSFDFYGQGLTEKDCLEIVEKLKEITNFIFDSKLENKLECLLRYLDSCTFAEWRKCVDLIAENKEILLGSYVQNFREKGVDLSRKSQY